MHKLKPRLETKGGVIYFSPIIPAAVANSSQKRKEKAHVFDGLSGLTGLAEIILSDFILPVAMI
jgi:hypothetical protein